MDFSKPVDVNENSIDISIENITTAIRLPDNVPVLRGGVLLISDGVIHMLPGMYVDGNPNDATTYPKNKVWNFDLESQEWDVQDSGILDQTEGTAVAYDDAVAFDADKQVGWYYGGNVMLNPPNGTWVQDLYRLDRGKETPIKVETNSSLVGKVLAGELVYIGGAGNAGILVLIGGRDPEVSETVSITIGTKLVNRTIPT